MAAVRGLTQQDIASFPDSVEQRVEVGRGTQRPGE
jgi:hypothetical protein